MIDCVILYMILMKICLVSYKIRFIFKKYGGGGVKKLYRVFKFLVIIFKV